MTDSPTIISRKDARAAGLKRYFTGKPCKHGHVGERGVGGGCIECHRELERKYRAADPGKYRERTRKARAADPDKWCVRARKYRAAYPEKHRELDRKRRLTKNGRLKMFWQMIKQRMGLKRGAREKLLTYTAEEFQAHLVSTLPEEMTYEQACKEGYQHDHIVPISYVSKHFSFEVACKMVVDLDNLRFIPATENMQKHSKMGAPYQLRVLDIMKERYL